jgi:hypothetical protein
MRRISLTLTLGLLASIAAGGMSGIYTIKPHGGGDFWSLVSVSDALESLGMSGNCVFELYDTITQDQFYTMHVTGSESYTTTFRPGPGENVLVDATAFYGFINNVKVESLRFQGGHLEMGGCSGWRIHACRFSWWDGYSVGMEACTHDTVDGCLFVPSPTASDYSSLLLSDGDSNAVFNNMFNSESTSDNALVRIEHERHTQFVFNTLRLSTIFASEYNAIHIDGHSPIDVRDNVFLLSLPSDTSNACAEVYADVMDSILLDYNCYFVESQGHIGRSVVSPYAYDWNGWRGLGFEAHGINADPLLKNASDLHLRPGSPCNTRATPIPGVNVDIDGDPRDPTHPDMGADEIAGGAVEESPQPQAASSKPMPTIVRGVLFLPRDLTALSGNSDRVPRPELLDVGGRKVLDLHPGANDVRALAPGVYFVREGAGARGEGLGKTRKVIVTR